VPLLSADSIEEFTPGSLSIQRLGLLGYEEAIDLQRKIHGEIASGVGINTFLLLEHPSIYTAGKRTTDAERPIDGTPVTSVDRGGKITWHGPGQLIGYPIVKLAKPSELVGFVRALEEGLIAVCKEFGITAQQITGRSGVWVCDERGDRKIAAIGIRVAQGISMHGFALNVNPDLEAFNRIIPCGISDAAVTSMTEELSRDISVSEVMPVVEKYLLKSLTKVSA
jgi:lipoyl(octanoyl) transferase